MKTPIVSRNFDLGFQSDLARDQLGRGAAYRMRDYIPQNEAALRKRGGWTYASKDINTLGASSSMAALGWAPFTGDPHLLVISNSGVVARSIPGPSGGDLISTGGPPSMTHRPFWFRDRMILPGGLRSAGITPKKVYSTGASTYALADVAGSPPQARVGTAWLDYVLLANSIADPDVIWASDPGNSDVWTTGAGGSFATAPGEVVRIVPMRNFILVFGYESVWMLRGDTPPPGGNWAWDDLFVGNGTFDGRTVANYRDSAIWANSSGIFKSDGATLTDLCEAGGISRFWQALVKDFSFAAGWDAAAGVDKGVYEISIHDELGAYVGTLRVDIDRAAWYEFTNIPAVMYAERTSGPGTVSIAGAEALFFACKDEPRAGDSSVTAYPTAATASDADGTAVEPELELPFYKLGSASLKRISRAWLTYHLESAGGTPQLEVDAIFTPEDTTYEALSPVLPATTKQEREHVFVRERASGAGFRIRQVGASADTRLVEFELGGHPLEESR